AGTWITRLDLLRRDRDVRGRTASGRRPALSVRAARTHGAPIRTEPTGRGPGEDRGLPGDPGARRIDACGARRRPAVAGRSAAVGVRYPAGRLGAVTLVPAVHVDRPWPAAVFDLVLAAGVLWTAVCRAAGCGGVRVCVSPVRIVS